MAEFGEKIKQARVEKGMTQQALADRLYVTRQTISRWERGTRYPDLPTAKKLADILEIPLDDLLSGEDLKKIKKKIKRQKGKDFLLAWLLFSAVTPVVLGRLATCEWGAAFVSDSEQETYESEEEILQNLPLGENTYFDGYVYSAGFTATSLHMNLVDSQGNIYTPVAERTVSESGEIMADLATEQENPELSPVFRFKVGEVELDDSEVTRILMTGLTYWVDEDGSVLYDSPISDFRFPVVENGSYDSGIGYDAAEIQEMEEGENFLAAYEAWIESVHEEGNIVEKSETIDWDTILEYDVQYPDYFQLDYTENGGYEVYTEPVGELSVQIRDREDGTYEIIETRYYCLDQNFLESTKQHSLEEITEKAGELSVNTKIYLADLINDAMVLNASDLAPAVDETIVYVADMPGELETVIDELRAAINE